MWYRLTRFCRSLKRSTKWFFFMWDKEDWEYYYFLKIIEKKLKELYYYYNNPKNINMIDSYRKSVVKKIVRTWFPLKRYLNDDYLNYPDYRAYWKLWGKTEFISLKDNPKLFEMVKVNVKTPGDKIREHHFFKKVSSLARKRKDNDLKLFTTNLNKYVTYWWD